METLDDEMKKLSPEERLKLLKKLEEKRKKQQEEIEKEMEHMKDLIEESKEELEETVKKEQEVLETEETGIEEKIEEEEIPEKTEEPPPLYEDSSQEGYKPFEEMDAQELGKHVQYLSGQVESDYVGRSEYELAGKLYKQIQEKEEAYRESGTLSENLEEQFSHEKDSLGKMLESYKKHRPF